MVALLVEQLCAHILHNQNFGGLSKVAFMLIYFSATWRALFKLRRILRGRDLYDPSSSQL